MLSDDVVLFLFLVILALIVFVLLLASRSGRGASHTHDLKAPTPREPPRPAKRPTPSAAQLGPFISNLPTAKVVKIIDGDTVIVSVRGSDVKIRLDSIDCPEDGQEWGDIAAYGLIKMIGGRVVHLESHGLDHHGRTLATLYVRHANDQEWVNVNERMVMLGHAWVMRKYFDHLPRDRQEKLLRLQHWARSRKVGLWKAQNPVPPWQWRYDGRV